MLKWTGGSRRKVSTSRKSTQSKQKQYFEQKRRLQQTPGIEHQSETDKWNHLSDARSLDLLSFVNLATVAQDKESVRTEYNNSTQTFNDPSKWSSPAALKKFMSVHPTKLNEEYDHNSSHVSREDNGDFLKLSPAMAVKKIFSELSNNPNESGSIPRTSSLHMPFAGAALNSKEKVGDFGKMSPSISFKSKSSDMKQKGESNMQSGVLLLDLLDDEHAERKSMQKSGHEEYVAFSVKGLGKVEVETPPQSPVLYQRGCPEPPQRAARCTQNREFQSIPFGIEMVPDSILHDINLLNDVGQSERMGDYGPFADDIEFDKENQFRGIYSPDSFDNFEGSPDCGQDNSFDKHIYDQIWKDTCEETAHADFPGKMCDRSWDTNLFNLDNFYRTSPNENIFDPGLTGCEDYNDFETLRIKTNTKRRLEEQFARPGPSSSSLTMENTYLPADSDWGRDIPKFERKSDFDGLFSPSVWPFKDGVAELRDATSLISEESCSSTRVTVKKVKNYSYQSYAQKQKKNEHMDDFRMDSDMNLNSPKFNNIPCQVHEKSTRRTKSNPSGSKMQKTSLSKDDMFLDCDLFTDCKMYTISKEPSRSVTIEQRSGTNLDFHANGEEKFDFFGEPESELQMEAESSCVGEIGLDMKERCSENKQCESEEISDEAENVGHIEADKCSLEESPLVLEACANGIPNTPAHSRQSKRSNLAQDSCDKVSPLSSQAENQGDKKGKCDAQYQVMLQSYVFQLLCVQKVLLEASGKDRNK